MDFTGRNIVVTGATSGIGLSIVEALAGRGDCQVCAVGRDERKLRALRERLPVYTIQCDLKVEDQVEAMVEDLTTPSDSWPGRVDIFIADAGCGYYEKLEARDWAHFSDIYTLNTISPLYTLSALLGRRGDGTDPLQFVFMCSGIARAPVPGYSLYTSTKAAIDGFVRAFRWEGTPGLILTACYPITVDTPFYRNGHREMKLPLMRQCLEVNTYRILQGIRRDKLFVYPSLRYRGYLIFRRVLPLESLHGMIEEMRLKKWQKKNDEIGSESHGT